MTLELVESNKVGNLLVVELCLARGYDCRSVEPCAVIIGAD